MASAEEESSSCSSDESLITREQPKASQQRLRSYIGSSSVAHSDSYSRDAGHLLKENFNTTCTDMCLFWLKYCLFWGEQPIPRSTTVVRESIDGVLYNEQRHQEGYPIKPIKNLGNTCYLNAIIQCLNQTTGVHDTIFGTRDREYNLSNDQIIMVTVNTCSGPISEELISLFDEIKTPQYRCIAPRSLLNKISEESDQFHLGTQQDSHEVLRLLLNKLQSEETEHIKKEVQAQAQHDVCSSSTSEESIHEVLQSVAKPITPVDEVFGGLICSTVICRDCVTPVQLTESFFDLQLSMPAPDQKQERWTPSPLTRKPKVRQITPVSDDALDYMQGINTSESELSGREQYHANDSWKHVISSPITVVNPCNFDSLQNSLRRRGMEYSAMDLLSLSPNSDLERSLKEYITIDVLDEENKFICSTCSMKTPDAYKDSPVNKQVLIKHLPPVLVLHIKRFVIGDHLVYKNDEYLSFPLVLNMAPYCTDACSEKFKDKNGHIMYGLYGVVVHNGSTLRGGHYVAYVKTRPKRQPPTSTTLNWEYDQRAAEGDTWHCTNDKSIKRCSKGFDSIRNKKAYLLFYELLPKSYM